MLTISTRLVKAHEQKAHGLQCAIALVQVGMVNGHGYDDQQEDAICDVRGPWQTIQSTFKPVYCWFWLIGYAYELLRCLDLKIWRFSWWQQMDRQTDYFIPAHACGIITCMSIVFYCLQAEWDRQWVSQCCAHVYGVVYCSHVRYSGKSSRGAKFHRFRR